MITKNSNSYILITSSPERYVFLVDNHAARAICMCGSLGLCQTYSVRMTYIHTYIHTYIYIYKPAVQIDWNIPSVDNRI